MNKQNCILVFTMLLGSFAAIGQKMPEDYLNEANKFFADSQWQKALANYRYIVNEHPRNYYAGLAWYEMGLMYIKMKKLDSTKAVYTRILQSKLYNMPPESHDQINDPYKHYKQSASEILSGIYFQEKNYPLALEYRVKADSVYQSSVIFLNEYSINSAYIVLRYAEIYVKLNQKDKAIQVLLSQSMIGRRLKGEKVSAELKILLKGKKNLKKDLDIAIANIYGKEIKTETDEISYKVFYMDFLGQKIKLPDYYLNSNLDEAGYIARLKQSSLYKMIEELENER